MRRAMGCALLFATLSGVACKTMRPVPLDQLTVLKPDRAWVTEADKSVLLVSGPQLLGDTLVGYVNGQYQELPTAWLTQVVVKRPAPTRTVLLAAGIAVGIGGFAFAIMGGGASGRDQSDVCDKHPDYPECNGTL